MVKHKRSNRKPVVSKAVKNFVLNTLDKRIEDKFAYHTTGVITLGPADVGDVRQLTQIAQGDGINQRVGSKIRIKWIKTRIVVGMVNGSNSCGRIRFVYTVNKQNNNTTMDGYNDDIGWLNSVSAGQGFRKLQNQETKQLFINKMDKSMDLQVYPYQPPGLAPFSSIAETHHIIKTIKFGANGMLVSYTDASGDPNTIITNCPYSIAYPDLITSPNTLSYELSNVVCFEDA